MVLRRVYQYLPWGNQSEIVITQETPREKGPPRAEIPDRIRPNSEYGAVDSGKILFAISG